MFDRPLSKRAGMVGLVVLLLVLIFEVTLSIRQQSLSWDEDDHLYAGYMSLTQRDFGMNPEHPPLVKALAALPLLPMHLKAPEFTGKIYFKGEAFMNGREFLFRNGGEPVASKMIFRARLASGLLTLLLGVLVFLAGSEMFGTGAALIGLALMVFEPNMVAHGAYVATDMGVACFMFATMYALYRYVKVPGWGRLVTLGIAAGLTLATKHSGVLILPMALTLLLTEVVWPQGGEKADRKKIAIRLAGGFVLSSLIAVFVLWAFYGFRFSARPGGAPLNPTYASYLHQLKGMEPAIFTALARWHVLPESYLYGMIDVRGMSIGFPTYIFGQVHAHGVWYYFPVAFVIKSTAAFLILLVITVFAIAAGKLRARREILFMAVPVAIYFIIAIGTGLNIGARHVLPMYAFLCVLIGAAAVALCRANPTWVYAVGLLLAWHMVSTTRAYPDYIAYSNEFWGGPSNTYKYLTDSNTDWAQQLKAVKTYLDERGVKDCYFAYFAEPVVDFRDYGIPCKPLPTADTGWFNLQVDTPATVTGTVLISAGSLTGFELGSNVLNPYRQFQKMKPTAVIKHGVFVYDGTFDMRFASALGHVTRANALAGEKKLDEALVEAQTAVEIDPDQLQAQMALGDTLVAMGRGGEAKPVYEKALAIAKTMEPDVAAEWVPQVEAKIAGK